MVEKTIKARKITNHIKSLVKIVNSPSVFTLKKVIIIYILSLILYNTKI